MMFLLCFSLKDFKNLRILINIHEYANKIICIFDNGIKSLYLSFNLVPSFSRLR